MDLNIIKTEESKLFNRKNVTFNLVGYDATPSIEKAKTELCKKLGASPDLTIIVKLDQEFGMKRSTGLAHIYEDKSYIDKYEKPYILKRIEKKKPKAAEQKEGD